MNKLESLKKKLIYRSNYRGTKEMDMILSKFVKKNIDSFSKEELEDLDKFLDFEDEIIYNFYQNNISSLELNNNKISAKLKKFKI
tara:strand:- start:60 stop:314 length:255 start_codon:yes stop_codon:yes gene_type:complete